MAFNFNPKPAAGGFSFGAPAAAPTPPTSLFGQPAPPAAAAPSTSLFGQTSTAPTSLFGTPAAKPNLFGTTTPAGTPGPTPLTFGAKPTVPSFGFGAAPAAVPSAVPALGGFGAPTAPAPSFGGGLFGGQKREADGEQGNAKKPSLGLFGGGTFGAPAAPTTVTPTPPLFGAATPTPNLFGAAPPAAPATGLFGAAMAPNPSATGGLFGAPAATPAISGGLFGAKPAVPSTVPLFGAAPIAAPAAPALFGAPATTPAPAPALFGAPAPATGLFGAPAIAPAPALGGGLFGAKPAAPAPVVAPAAGALSLFGAKPATPAAPTAVAPLSFGFGAPAATTSALAAPGALNLGVKPAVPILGASTVTAPVPSLLKGKTLDEIVNNWGKELEERLKDFHQIGAEVIDWDRILRKNGDLISSLYNSLLPLSPLQNSIESSLDFIETQQADLEKILDGYEESIGGLVEMNDNNSSYRNSNSADKEREKTYGLATTLNTSLSSTFTSLTSLIETLNALSPSTPTNASSSTEADPLEQISLILNGHLNSLKWIESTTENLKLSVKELEGRVGIVGRSMSVNVGSGAGNGLRESGFGRSSRR